jgi:hypothetical protein
MRLITKICAGAVRACLLLVCFLIYQAFFSSFVQAGVNPYIQTFLLYKGNPVKSEEIPKLAKFDLLEMHRYKYNDIPEGTWKALKARNPEIGIYIYQMGPEISDNQDAGNLVGLFSVGRFNNSRGHTMGAVNTHHPEFFLTDSSGNRIRHPQYPTCWLLDFGSPNFLAYWIESTLHDIVNQPWKADGIFVDNCLPVSKGRTIYGVMPQKYPAAKVWNENMQIFINGVVRTLHNNKQKVVVNRGNSRHSEGYEAWIDLDRSAYPPDVVMEEGAFSVKYGDSSDVQFYSEEDWRRQVDIAGQIQHSKIIMMSHSDLREGETGRDNKGNLVSFWQVLWYSMCSYHLARQDNPNNCYFSFTSPSDKNNYVIPWFDEFDAINLGRALGVYKVQQIGEKNVYYREFEKGYIYVNPTGFDVPSVLLPQMCVQITHERLADNFDSFPVVSSVALPAHTGVIVMKKAAGITPSSSSPVLPLPENLHGNL